MKKTILTYILTFLFCLLFLAGATSAFLYDTMFDTEKYIEKMVEKDYGEVVLQAVYKDIDDMGDVITLNTDDIYNLVDEESLVEHSKNYTKAYLEAMLNGKDFTSESIPKYSMEYARDDLKSLVEKFYEGSDQNFSDDEFSIIFDYVEKQINSSIKFLSTKILEKTLPYGKYLVVAKSILKYARLALIPCLILLLGIILLNLKNGLGTLLYRTGAAVFLPSAILFIPTLLFDNYNLNEKIVLARSPLSIVFSSVMDTLVKGFEFFTFMFFIISLIVIIIGATITAFKKNRT